MQEQSLQFFRDSEHFCARLNWKYATTYAGVRASIPGTALYHSAGGPRRSARRQRISSRQERHATLEYGDAGASQTDGFLSSFRDWAAERTNFPHEVAEMALAHTVGDKARGRIPLWRPIPEAPANHGDMGAVLRDPEGAGKCRDDQWPRERGFSAGVEAGAWVRPKQSCCMPVAVLRRRGERRVAGMPFLGFSRPTRFQ